MAHIERSFKNKDDANFVSQDSIDQSEIAFIVDLLPATLIVYIDTDGQGRVIPGGNISSLAISVGPEVIEDITKPISFGKEQPVLIGDINEETALKLTYNPTTENRILRHFQRNEVK